MSNSILVVKDSFGSITRIVVDTISTYGAVGQFVEILLTNGRTVTVECNINDLDQALTELCFMMKPVKVGLNA